MSSFWDDCSATQLLSFLPPWSYSSLPACPVHPLLTGPVLWFWTLLLSSHQTPFLFLPGSWLYNLVPWEQRSSAECCLDSAAYLAGFKPSSASSLLDNPGQVRWPLYISISKVVLMLQPTIQCSAKGKMVSDSRGFTGTAHSKHHVNDKSVQVHSLILVLCPAAYRPNVFVPQNSYVETHSLMWQYLEVGALGGDQVRGWNPHEWD